MCENGVALWKLSMRKKMINNLLLIIRNLVLKWWAKEIHVSPNKAKMIRKIMKPNTFDEKFTHFLMETQVYLPPNLMILIHALKVVTFNFSKKFSMV
jgi:hypothetical protein